jgi:molybdenum cofactor cytidylyltransferase
MRSDVIILILAAGSSARMRGQDKLLNRVQGESLLHLQARLALETGCPVVVVLPDDTQMRSRALGDLNVTIAKAPNSNGGMAVSIQCGLTAARGLPGEPLGIMILPADMPDFNLAALNTVLDAFASDPARIVRATSETGQPGHPIIFPQFLWNDLAQITGDTGGKAVLENHPNHIRHITLPGDMAITDLDTPEEWELWRAARSDRR